MHGTHSLRPRLDRSLSAGDNIATCVLAAYSRLPPKCKPLARKADAREWVPLAGIVLATWGTELDHVEGPKLECVALGTGMKCLPASKVASARGIVLHDSHAEIIAARAFNRFLIDECLLLAQDPVSSSLYVRRRAQGEINGLSPQPFAIRKGVSIHMYSSEAPCGDASMELIMAAQEDATPWPIVSAPATMNAGSSEPPQLKGRGSFGELGIVRRKPARPDAPNALSKSCTDKLAMYQVTSLLSSTTSLLVTPRNAYLSTFTVPKSQFVESAFKRAFTTSGRLNVLGLVQDDTYSFQPFIVHATEIEFQWSRRAVDQHQKAVPSTVSAVYTPHTVETLINGVLQGRKFGDPTGASSICRRSLWLRAMKLAELLDDKGIMQTFQAKSYGNLKASEMLAARRRIKDQAKAEALTGWIPNAGDESFGLSHTL